jgi:hypothetical protein
MPSQFLGVAFGIRIPRTGVPGFETGITALDWPLISDSRVTIATAKKVTAAAINSCVCTGQIPCAPKRN